MSNMNFDFVPLTFISDQEEIRKQIRNTIILIHLFEKYNTPVRLENLIEGTQYGYNASALQSGKNKFLRISDIHESKVNWETVPFCNCDDEKTYLLKKEDILIARTGGTTGKSFKIDNPPANSIYAGYLIRIRAKQEVNPDYIYLFLHSFAYWSQIVNLNERNFRPKANAENLKSLILPDCPIDIQNDAVKISIGESVSGYEELYSEIEKALAEYNKTQEVQILLSDQLTQLDNLNQAILQEAVQGKLVPQDPNDEPASELLKRIKIEKSKSGKKDKPLPPIKPEEIPFEIPENWVWCRLGEMSINRDGERKPISQAERNGRQKIYDYYGASGVIDKIDGYTHEGELLLIGEDGANLIARSTPIAFLAKGKFWVNNHAHVLDSVDRITLDYLCTYINSITLKPFVTGGFQPKLSQGNLNIIPVPLPPLSEQKRIVAELEKQFAKTNQLKEHIIANKQATEQLLKALLHQAFEVKDDEEFKQNANANQLPGQEKKEDNHFVKRKILATYIINQSLNDLQFGDVKFEKLLHLSDYFAIKRNFGQKYYKKVAGPLDNSFTIPFFQQIEKSKWFSRQKRGRQSAFIAGVNHNNSLNTYGYFSKEELSKVDKIINYFKKYDYEQPEIVSTLYAVWNNRLIMGQLVEVDSLINDFYEWDEAKKKYSRDRLIKAIEWMTKENLIPDGWGEFIDKPKTKNK